ncbi:F-box protein [Cardamine amara subsp. amara]|uniref:F-box protein n=1 Tax=Cardamine amara subsp. amara TaxID=228776 RepID=A0ABD1BKJ2_CARAN
MERSTLKRRSSSSDLESAKALRSSLILRPKVGSPLVMLSREKEGCGVYKPDEDRVYETKRDFSGYRFLGNSGKWSLVVDSRMKFYIVDVFSEEMIDLPPIESFKGTLFRLERLGDNVRNRLVSDSAHGLVNTAEDLRGRLWVDDNNGDYVVVWVFQRSEYIGFCKKGDDHYREILLRGIDVHWQFRGFYDFVLKGHHLYIHVVRGFIRHLDLSAGHDGDFKDVSERQDFALHRPSLMSLCMDERERIKINKIISFTESIAVTRSGQVLLVYTYELNSAERQRMFHLYKRNPNPTCYETEIVEVDSLGDEALFLDLGTTVPADHTLGIEPNSIYFTRGDRIYHRNTSCLDICVFNLTTKTIKRFPTLSNLNLKDAQWFLPS